MSGIHCLSFAGSYAYSAAVITIKKKPYMSKKGCSPDNSACEGFFGHLKMEMFYGRNWSNSTLDDLIQAINKYMNWSVF